MRDALNVRCVRAFMRLLEIAHRTTPAFSAELRYWIEIVRDHRPVSMPRAICVPKMYLFPSSYEPLLAYRHDAARLAFQSNPA